MWHTTSHSIFNHFQFFEKVYWIKDDALLHLKRIMTRLGVDFEWCNSPHNSLNVLDYHLDLITSSDKILHICMLHYTLAYIKTKIMACKRLSLNNDQPK